MAQVEARAKYAAQREFPDADILHPMWDIDHLMRGVEAISNYPIGEFHRTFRDFYEALESPAEFVSDASRVDDRTWEIHKSFTITPDNRIEDVLDVALVAATDDGDSIEVGPEPTDYEYAITAGMPMMDFADDFDFEAEFHEIVVANLMAQVRDLYLHMGEQPPEEYQIEGFGKFSINGDRTHAEWRGVTDENGDLIGPK
ncbi:hypothetical protein [Halococcoides cellulosivorans]|uniref:hypothetical protein n=1 Tax=Halococcoides cellulosivorans TaxID=1679096 RepID=UPI001F2ECA1A|nr:hypothetical protein [Halococcoides cellulosivorans]